ncbi:hypothetical protein DFR70_12649 [Nocardia tenerifensis]|uniref:Uncharacterized protein n=1 Tax=Nocardia tenerifensis TaxID=228006 RepID=A0A318JNZ6_9NOCA|nr:hypothetical protein [Nocardia tenerifensis]PXX53928.1 hypothetical protein DFR70_12649 [Nocardia tenerifensis]
MSHHDQDTPVWSAVLDTPFRAELDLIDRYSVDAAQVTPLEPSGWIIRGLLPNGLAVGAATDRADEESGLWLDFYDLDGRLIAYSDEGDLQQRLDTASELTPRTIALLRHGARPAELPASIRVMPHTVLGDEDGDRLEITDLGDGRERLTITSDADAVRRHGSFQSVDVPRDQLLALLGRLTDRFTRDFGDRSLDAGDTDPDQER